MTKKIYAGVIKNSELNRSDVHMSDDRSKVLEWLYKEYNEIMDDYFGKGERDIYDSRYENIEEFTSDAILNMNCAYIQASDLYVSFELHEDEITV